MCNEIMFIIPSFNVGGAERVTINVIKWVERQGEKITLVVLDGRGSLREEVPKGVEVIDLNTGRLRFSIISIASILKERKPATVFSTIDYVNFAVIFIIRILKINTNVVIREASTPSMVLKEMTFPKKNLYPYIYRFLYSKADFIVAQCDCMKKDIIDNFLIRDSQVVRIYNPIDVERVRRKSKVFFPSEFSPHAVNIVTAGRLVESKGYGVLLKAFSVLLKNVSNAKLFIIGDGPLRNGLSLLARELEIENEVRFLGFLANPYPYIRYADLYVLSSNREGFPNVLLEALACGTKVVATDCNSGPREIIGNNEFGHLARVNDPDSLALAMHEYLNTMNKTADRAEMFDISKGGQQYSELFRLKS